MLHDLGIIGGVIGEHGGTFVWWDDVAEEIINSATVQDTGTIIAADYHYSFCTGTTKTYFVLQLNSPYAIKVDEENSMDCGYSICDIIIELIQTTPDNGTQNGTAKITATGTGKFEYKLDYDGTYQDSNCFTGISYGIHKVYVHRVGSGCIKTQSFEILLTETYNIRWRAEFNNDNGDNIIIYLSKKDYVGEIENVTCGNPPLIINYDAGESKISDLYNTIKGSNAEITFLAQTNNQFDELFAINERDIKVSIYKNLSLFWQGFVIPNVCQEPYKSIYTISFTAIDGLGTLRTKDFKSANYYSGWKIELEILKICLDKLNLKLNICDGIVVKEVTMDVGSTLSQTFVNTDKYTTIKGDDVKVYNCYDVINDILLKYDAYIKQIDNEWHILNKQTSYDLWCYDYTLKFIEKKEINTYSTLTNDTGNLYFVHADAVRELFQGFKEINIKQNYGLTHLIKNYNFKNWDDNIVENWGGNATYYRENDNIRILGHNVESITECTYLQSTDNNIFIDENAELKIKIKFSIPLYVAGTTSMEYYELPIGLIINDNTWNGENWQTNPFDVLKIRANGQTTEYESELIPIKNSGKIRIKIFECMQQLSEIAKKSVSVAIDYCDVEIVQTPILKEFVNIKIENNDNFIYVPDELEINSGDFPSITNVLIYKNGLKIKGEPSTSWVSPYGTDTIINLLAQNIITQHKNIKSILTGTVKGELSEIIYNSFDGNYYFVVEKNTNYRNNESEVKLMQIEIKTISDTDYLKINDFDYLLINNNDRLIL